MEVKVYSPRTAKCRFYCHKCENQVTPGDTCYTIEYPLEDGNKFPRQEAVCLDCVFEEVE